MIHKTFDLTLSKVESFITQVESFITQVLDVAGDKKTARAGSYAMALIDMWKGGENIFAIEGRQRKIVDLVVTYDDSIDSHAIEFVDDSGLLVLVPEEEVRLDIESIGVEGSLTRRIYDLMSSLDFKLIDIKDADHASRLELVFDEGNYISTITIEDTEKP